MRCEKCGRKVCANERCVCGEKAPGKNNGLVRANAVICFIVLMITVSGLLTTLSLRTVVNRNMLVESVRSADLSEIRVDNKKLDRYIYDEYVDDPRITVENVNNLLNEPFIKDFIAGKAEDFQDYAMEGGEIPKVTVDEVINLIDENEELLYNEAGLRFLEPDKAELRENLKSLSEFESFSDEFFGSTLGTKFYQTYFSQANVIFCVILMAVIFIQWLIVYKANSRRASKMLIMYGLGVIIPSVIGFAAAGVIKLSDDLDAFDKILGSSLTPFIIYPAVLLTLGLIFMVMGILSNKSYKASRSMEADVVPVQEETPAAVSQPEEPVQPVSEKKVCPGCSHENKASASFCSRCGTKLE